MNIPNRLILVGFMGAGKTTLGKGLAGLLDRPFFDLDDLIEAQEGRTIKELFADKGETYFREREHHLVLSLAEILPSQVILACGGGTPCFFDNMIYLNRIGETIYLQISPKVLAQRLSAQRAERPILADIPAADLPTVIARRVAQREPFYQQASRVVLAENHTAKSLIDYLYTLDSSHPRL